eukprot:jgi/Chlat1/1398/Chrsp12S01974
MATALVQQELTDKAAQEIARLFEAYLRHSTQGQSTLQRLVKESSNTGEGNPFAIASREIVDTLTKQWAGGGAAAASSQLEQKQRRHAAYLQFLQVSGTWELLHESTQLAILEHGEKTAAMVALREAHNFFVEQRWAQGDEANSPALAQEDNQVGAPSANMHAGRALQNIIQAVWESEQQLSSLLAGRDPAEVFYARVSHIASFYVALQLHAKRLVGGVADAAVAFEYLTELSEAAAAAVNAAFRYKSDVTERLLPERTDSRPTWLASLEVRGGLQALVEATIAMRPRLRAAAPTALPALAEQLLGLAELTLDNYRRAVAVDLNNNQDASSLRNAYVELRDGEEGIMPNLLADAFEAAEEAGQTAGPAAAEAALKDKLAAMQPLAEQHYAYQALAEICERTGDVDGLHHVMEDMRDAQEHRGDGRFSTYMFERFVDNKQYAQLLILKPNFDAELDAFLRDRWDLSWLHQVRTHKYKDAAQTLSKLASQSGRTLANRKRALCIGKIARLAENDCDEAASIDAALELVAVQSELQGRDAPGNVALEPHELVEECLAVKDTPSRRRTAVLGAFHAFAVAGGEFHKCNRSLLERAWLAAAGLDDWHSIQQHRAEMSDSRYVVCLRATAVYAAAVRCYGQLGVVGEPVDQVMPIERVEELLMANMRADQGADALLEAVKQAAVDVGVMQ